MAYVLYANNNPNNSILDVQSTLATCIGYTHVDDLDPGVIAWCAQNGSLNFLQFNELFTQEEQANIATSTDPATKVFVMRATGSGDMQMSNTLVQDGISYIAGLGLISNTRVAEILSGTVPSSN